MPFSFLYMSFTGPFLVLMALVENGIPVPTKDITAVEIVPLLPNHWCYIHGGELAGAGRADHSKS